MPQRRTPSGQGPGARGGRDVRGARRTGSRDWAVRSEQERSAGLRGANRSGTSRSGANRSGASRSGASRSGATRTGATDTRSANRPAAARRASAGGTARRTRAPQPRRLTGRAAVLCMVLIGLLLAYAYPVRVYLSQQNQIDQLQRSQAAQLARIHDLSGQLDKWNDDEYIKAQARGRLLMQMPGDKTMLVIDNTQAQAKSSSAGAGQVSGDAGPWYGKLWSSIRAADQGAR